MNSPEQQIGQELEVQESSQVEEARDLVRSAFVEAMQPIVLPESSEWDAICARTPYAAQRVTQARAAGVPDIVIEQFAHEFVEQQIRARNFEVAANFMQNMGFGHEKHVARLRMFVAEWKKIQKGIEEAGVEKQSGRMPLHASALMEEFVRAIHALPPAERQIAFKYLWEFHPDQFEELQAMAQDPSHGKDVTIDAFFGEDLVAMDASLPIAWLTTEQWTKLKAARLS